MNLEDIQSAVDAAKGSLYPSLGDMTGFDVHRQDQSVFSETIRVRLHYAHASRNIVLKHSTREPGVGSKNRRAVEVEYEILHTLYQKFRGIDGMNVVRPLACLPEDDILVMEEFAGSQLSNVIVQLLRWRPSPSVELEVERYFTLCGSWLRRFQQFTREEDCVPFDSSQFLEKVETLLEAVQERRIRSSLRKRLLQFAKSACDEIGERQVHLVAYHSDFTPWNILAGDSNIAVMDFGQFSRSTSYDDLTLFLATLEGYKSVIGVRGDHITHMRSAFLEGYGASAIDPELFDLFVVKNTIKTIWMMDYSKYDEAGVIDRLYRDYRKRKQLDVHLRRLEQLTS